MEQESRGKEMQVFLKRPELLPEKHVLDAWCNSLIRLGKLTKLEGDGRAALWYTYVEARELRRLLTEVDEAQERLNCALKSCVESGLRRRDLNKMIQTKRSWYVASRLGEARLTPLSVDRLLESMHTEDMPE
jgi:hypothetical protein